MLMRKTFWAVAAFQLSLLMGLGIAAGSDAKDSIRKGNKAVQEKNYPKALKEFESAISADPKNSEAHLLAGLTSSKLGDHTKAVELIQNSIKIEPSFTAWRSLGLIYADRASLDKAKEAYKKALEFSPDSFQAWYELGLLQSSSGNYAEAVSCYEKATRFNSRFENAYLGMGAAYYWLGDKPSAIKQVAALKMLGMNDKAKQLEAWIKNKEMKRTPSDTPTETTPATSDDQKIPA